ncbi:MAG: hypothetical protein IKP06_06015 [Elusimicrobiaceae bacterium]|nr:hypothetical protein [Elusimicrobiaceae bacterium]
MLLHHVQPSFAGGEVSPALQTRVDSPAYSSWLKKARNFYIHPQGGASNRPGTVYMGTAKYNGRACRLIPFAVSDKEAYVLELGHEYMRAYTSAGQLLTATNEPFELATPYKETDLSSISYTQYDQTLFLTHPQYPPRRLVYLGQGNFRLEVFPIQYGPFRLSNTEPDKKMRIASLQEDVETAGVAAELTFLPIVDNRYFVYGYFQGELFFAARGYGLDTELLVSEFNRVNGSSGVEAVNLGGLIKITSPQATGGDWNGATLQLVYRDSFVHDPSLIIEQQLSGGVNEGETIAQGEITYTLESNFDVFSPKHVGMRFSVCHPVPSQRQKGALGYESSSAVIKSSSDWSLRTSGTWTGTLVLEKSEDLGTSWQAVKYFVRDEDDDNLADIGHLEDTGGIYYLRLRSCQITGEAGYELTSASFMQEGIAVVSRFLNARQVGIEIERTYGSDDWTADWAEGSFGEKNGYPSCVFFYQDRLGFAGSYAEPQAVWFSKIGAYNDFGHARAVLEDSDAISINLSGKKLNAIHTVSVAGKLLVFTAGSEWSISSNGALTPYNIQVEQQGERGASRVGAVLVGNRTLYVQARAGALRDFHYDYNSASYVGEDLTLCAKHLFANEEIREICYQQEPDNLVWCILSNGHVAALTYVPEQNVCAWTHHDTQGYFHSVCVIPNRGYDEIWFAVERNGKYLIEKLLPRLISRELQEQIFLDSSVSKKSTDAFEEVSGLDHLEGCWVGVLADGKPLERMRVSNGKITLPTAMKCVHVGLLYQAQLQTLPAVSQLPVGLNVDQKKRIVGVTLQLASSYGGEVALEGEPLEKITPPDSQTNPAVPALTTRSCVLPLAGTHQLAPSILLEQNEPWPLTLLAVLCRVV